MSYSLRPYQIDLIDKVETSWGMGNRSVMLQLSTGGGKTVIFSQIVNQATQLGLRCLVLAHRTELIQQASSKIQAITGQPTGIIQSGYKSNPNNPIQVASVQTLTRRLDRYPAFDLIVIDEAHHSTAKSYQKILGHYPDARVLGVSATPNRLDGSGFDRTFDDLVHGISTHDLIASGNLNPYKYYAAQKPMSTKGVKKAQGDYRTNDLALANPSDVIAADVVKAYTDHLQGKQAVVFCINVKHSQEVASSLEAAGIPSAHLDGKTSPEMRSTVMEAFRAGSIRVLTNCALFDEGLDIPGLDGVILARPTASLSRYLQMVGRALRTAEGKEQAHIVDLADNWTRHGLPCDSRTWTLDGVKNHRGVALERDSQTGLVIPRPRRKTAKETHVIGWVQRVNTLIDTQRARAYNPWWIYHQLLKSGEKPPIDALSIVANHLGGCPEAWCDWFYNQWTAKHDPFDLFG